MVSMLIISMVLVASYIGATLYHTREIPESVSAMVYVFKEKWLWTIWIWAVGFTLAPCLMETLDESFKFLGFGTIAMLLFCGAMPLFDKDNNALHNFFGTGAGILSQICVTIINPWWLMTWLAYAILFFFETANKSFGEWKWSVFVAECICYTSLFGVLLN